MITIKKSTVTSLLFLKYALLFTAPQGDDSDILSEHPEYILHLKDNTNVAASVNSVQNFKFLTTAISQEGQHWAVDLTDSPVTFTTFSQLDVLLSKPATEWNNHLKKISNTYGIKGIENLYNTAKFLQLKSDFLKIIADFLTTLHS